MKIRQNPRHWAARKALTMPGISAVANYGLVRLHTKIFLEKAAKSRQDERKDHLDAFFDATMDTYLAALQADYSEAQAREITHIQANFDFFTHGWTEMMEIPGDELEEHYRRYDDFFSAHDITIDDALGEFRPATGVPSAPATPEKRDAATYENAIAGFSDDVYVELADGEMTVGSGQRPDEIDPTAAPGVEDNTE
ncbi:DUF6149 family protein [Halovenus rubra]|uniref:DUF6149 family protein n=2 Tax=Halovenus rubra TaxID=869890 RepID=A0ABD5X8F5_9EURY|nr:DUF6149 family protein [Halovenus rubra]